MQVPGFNSQNTSYYQQLNRCEKATFSSPQWKKNYTELIENFNLNPIFPNLGIEGDLWEITEKFMAIFNEAPNEEKMILAKTPLLNV